MQGNSTDKMCLSSSLLRKIWGTTKLVDRLREDVEYVMSGLRLAYLLDLKMPTKTQLEDLLQHMVGIGVLIINEDFVFFVNLRLLTQKAAVSLPLIACDAVLGQPQILSTSSECLHQQLLGDFLLRASSAMRNSPKSVAFLEVPQKLLPSVAAMLLEYPVAYAFKHLYEDQENFSNCLSFLDLDFYKVLLRSQNSSEVMTMFSVPVCVSSQCQPAVDRYLLTLRERLQPNPSLRWNVVEFEIERKQMPAVSL